MSQGSTSKKKTGRPTKFKPEYCDQLIAHMRQGFTFETFAAVCDVVPSTIYYWADNIEEFSEAKKIAHACAVLYHQKVLDSIGKNSKDRNPTPSLFMLKNLGLNEDREIRELQKEKLRLEIARLKEGIEEVSPAAKYSPEDLKKMHEITRKYQVI